MNLEQLKKIFRHATAETWHQHRNPDGTVGGWVENTASVAISCMVSGNAQVSGNAWVSGNARVSGNAQVYGNAQVSGNAWVYDNAQVAHRSDIQWITSIGSESGTLTLIRHNQYVIRGCFCGTLDDFKAAVAKKQENDASRSEYEALFSYLDFWFSQPLRGNYSKLQLEAEG